jgi:hypothetical protein
LYLLIPFPYIWEGLRRERRNDKRMVKYKCLEGNMGERREGDKVAKTCITNEVASFYIF